MSFHLLVRRFSGVSYVAVHYLFIGDEDVSIATFLRNLLNTRRYCLEHTAPVVHTVQGKAQSTLEARTAPDPGHQTAIAPHGLGEEGVHQ
jgi:hypothetical protein